MPSRLQERQCSGEEGDDDPSSRERSSKVLPKASRFSTECQARLEISKGVSGTGVRGGCPWNQATRLSRTSCPMASRVYVEPDPTCGSSMTLSRAIKSAGTFG